MWTVIISESGSSWQTLFEGSEPEVRQIFFNQTKNYKYAYMYKKGTISQHIDFQDIKIKKIRRPRTIRKPIEVIDDGQDE